jgi:hypothetical protein
VAQLQQGHAVVVVVVVAVQAVEVQVARVQLCTMTSG